MAIIMKAEMEHAICAGLKEKVAVGIKAATGCKRVGVAVLGMEVNHVHVHLIPLDSEKDMLFSNPKLQLPAAEMAEIANSIAQAIDPV